VVRFFVKMLLFGGWRHGRRASVKLLGPPQRYSSAKTKKIDHRVSSWKDVF
jgi:hypothetical protein